MFGTKQSFYTDQLTIKEEAYILGESIIKPNTLKKNSIFQGRILSVGSWRSSDRNSQVLRSLQQLYSSGRLANTGYLSILPVDQGIEHSGAASFAPNPIYFDPENIVKLALEAGCNGVATTLGVLGMVSRQYAH